VPLGVSTDVLVRSSQMPRNQAVPIRHSTPYSVSTILDTQRSPFGSAPARRDTARRETWQTLPSLVGSAAFKKNCLTLCVVSPHRWGNRAGDTARPANHELAHCDCSADVVRTMLDQPDTTTDPRGRARQTSVVGSSTVSAQASARSQRWTPHIIVLSGLVLALLCDAFVAQVLSANYHETYRAADAANADLARALEEYTLRNMEGVDLLLRTTIDDFTNDPSLLSAGNPALIDELKRRVAPYPAASALVVLDAAGDLLGDSIGNGVPGREFNFADRPYYRVQRDDPDRGLFIDVPTAARASAGRRFIAVSRALQAPDGRFAGVVFTALDYESVRRFFRSLNVGSRGAVTLYRDDGTLLLREPTEGELSGRDLSAMSLFSRRLRQAPSGNFDGKGAPDGTPRRVSYRRVAGMPLVVVVARDPVEFLAGWKNNALYYSAVAAALNLLIAGLGVGLARQWRLREGSERALRENLEQHRLVTENVPAMIVHVGADHRVRYANRVALEWYAQPSAAAALARKIEEFVDSARRVELRPKIEAALAGRATRGEEKALFPDGQERWCDTTRVPDIGQDGTVRGYFVLSVDITERRRFEDELRQVQKIEAIGQLAGGIAHDSNNMLAATLGNLDLLLDALPADEVPCRAFAERAIEAAEKVADLNRRLLAFARKQTLRPQITDVNQLVGGMTAILRRTLGETIEIELRQDPELWSCLIDPAQLQNALLNLAINARDAMPGGGRVTIRTANAVLVPSPEDGGESIVPGDYVAIAVSDMGVGMPPDIARRAFEPFFTTKDVGKGNGLGLSMVYGFARQSEGTVRISSKVAHGTTVTLYLPSAGRAAGRDERAGPTPQRRGAGERILVVEDNPLVARMASSMLSALGYDPIVVTDAPAATAEMERPDPVALLLTDVVLPGGMTGFDLARQARRRRPDLPVLFISGFADPSLVPDDFRADTTLLTKPFRAAQLSEAVAAALAGARAT
jgi:PAS domain S-box-containing protein